MFFLAHSILSISCTICDFLFWFNHLKPERGQILAFCENHSFVHPRVGVGQGVGVGGPMDGPVRLGFGTILSKGCGAEPPDGSFKECDCWFGVCFRGDCTSNALCGKFENIPRNETARPRSIFYILVSVSDLYITTIVPQTQYNKKVGPIVEIFKSLTDTWM